MIGKMPHHTKNSKELTNHVNNLEIDENVILKLYDMVSLITGIATKEIYDIVRNQVLNNSTLQERTLVVIKV